jgi:8-oxo-dGTP pyrophosphatase MutT (NUDIX family)
VKIIGKKILWEGRFLRTVLIEYPDPFGQEVPSDTTAQVREWESVERVNCDGVVGIVPFTEDGAVIMIRQFRPPVNAYVIELPAGLCDQGETKEDAARRELLEETGYAAKEVHFLTEGPLSSGSSCEMLSVFVATGLTFAGIGNRDETENIEVLKVPMDSLGPLLEDLRKAGNYVDLKVYGLIELAGNFTRNRPA